MIHFVIGTRAQLIKTAPVMRECARRGLPYNFIFLAQHKNTIHEMIEMFGIKRPDRILGDYGSDITSSLVLMKWLVDVFREGMSDLRGLFRDDREGVVVVHGDALPVLIGAIFARLAGLKVAHVEAGLRSFNYGHPFPEELIRVLTWKLGLVDHYFCPNDWAMRNVAVYPGTKYNTRLNTLIDSLRMALDSNGAGSAHPEIPDGRYAIATLHRFETISSRENMLNAFNILDSISRELEVLFILHPPTERAMIDHGLYPVITRNPRIHLRPRYKYFDFIRLLKGSELLISDGGSNQEECYYLGHPCLLLRNATERTEGIGENVLLSQFDNARIEHFLNHYNEFRREEAKADWGPSRSIVDVLEGYASTS